MPGHHPHHGQNKRRDIDPRNPKDIIQNPKGNEAIQTHQYHDSEGISDHGPIDGTEDGIASHEDLYEVASHVVGAEESDGSAEDGAYVGGEEGDEGSVEGSVDGAEDEAGGED